MQPFTAAVPKVLLPIDGIPVIELLITELRQQGIRDFTVVTSHLAEMVQESLGSGERLGVRIRHIHESQPLDTAGCLGQLNPAPGPFLLVNADIVTDFRFMDLLRFHRRLRAMATVAVCRHQVDVDFGVVDFDAEGRMSNYREKAACDFMVSMGIYCLEAEVCRLVARGKRLSMPQLLLLLQDSGQIVGCHRQDCYWRDIGRPEDYARANEEFAGLSQHVRLLRAA